MRKLLIAIAGTAALAACAIPELSEEEARAMSSLDLCQTMAWARTVNDWQRINRSRTELIRRGAVSKRDLADIDAKEIRTGMRDYVAVCSWGPFSDINRSGGSYGSFDQYVMYPMGTYVYTRNGKVDSWQQ